MMPLLFVNNWDTMVSFFCSIVSKCLVKVLVLQMLSVYN